MFIDNEPFQQGHTAYQAGLPWTACPYLFDAAPRKFWICGYELAMLQANEAAFNAEPLRRVDLTPNDQGKTAYAKGLLVSDNPYDEGTRDWSNWHWGWIGAANEATRNSRPEPRSVAFSGDVVVSPNSMLPIIDQSGQVVGRARTDVTRVLGWVDDQGTVWTPPTAWAYMACCRALSAAQDRVRVLETDAAKLLDDGK